MTKDEIIDMAESCFIQSKNQIEFIELFAKLVAQHEREACAKVCEEYETNNDITATWLNIVAEAIRARGQA